MLSEEVSPSRLHESLRLPLSHRGDICLHVITPIIREEGGGMEGQEEEEEELGVGLRAPCSANPGQF